MFKRQARKVEGTQREACLGFSVCLYLPACLPACLSVCLSVCLAYVLST